ncbi:MAG: cytochrome c-type biogenesis CcmF C-terminal domain-containing protein, partial [Gemmobacter sp.]
AGHIAWEREDIRVARIGDSFAIGAYTITLEDVRRVEGPNYVSTMGVMAVDDGRRSFTLYPEKRFYPVARMPTTEAAIDYGFWRDVYLVLGDPQDGGGYAVRSYIKPFANWLWAGCIIMALGGCVSLADRRYRIAAGAGKAPRAAVPAE